MLYDVRTHIISYEPNNIVILLELKSILSIRRALISGRQQERVCSLICDIASLQYRSRILYIIPDMMCVWWICRRRGVHCCINARYPMTASRDGYNYLVKGVNCECSIAFKSSKFLSNIPFCYTRLVGTEHSVIVNYLRQSDVKKCEFSAIRS